MNNYDDLFNSLRRYIKALDDFIIKGNKVVDKDSFISELEKDELIDEVNENIIAAKEFEDFINVIKNLKFEYDVIPYSKITKIVYEVANEELLDMLEEYLEKSWTNYLTKYNDENITQPPDNLIKNFLKIKEHIGLSRIQLTQLHYKLSNQIDRVSEEHKKLEVEIKNYKKTKREMEKALEDSLKNIQSELQKQYNRIITQFITILGIFSAILMGAFGTIQGFTSIFNNAHMLALGKILIISSIGCSAVVLIIFFLLSFISKMSGLEISSCNCSKPKKKKRSFLALSKFIGSLFSEDNEEDEGCSCPTFMKYPSVIIVHYVLFFISVIGLVLLIASRANLFMFFEDNWIASVCLILLIILCSVITLIVVHKQILNGKK